MVFCPSPTLHPSPFPPFLALDKKRTADTALLVSVAVISSRVLSSPLINLVL